MGRSPRDVFCGATSKGTEVQSEDMSDAFSLSVLHYRLFFRSLKRTLCSLRSSTACQGLCASAGELSAHTQVDCFVSVCVCERKALVMDLKFVHYTKSYFQDYSLVLVGFSWKYSTGVSELHIGNRRVGSSPSESPGSCQFAQFLLLVVLGLFWYHRAVGRFWQPMYSFLISSSVRGGVELHGAPARVTFSNPRAASDSRGVVELWCWIREREKEF